MTNVLAFIFIIYIIDRNLNQSPVTVAYKLINYLHNMHGFIKEYVVYEQEN